MKLPVKKEFFDKINSSDKIAEYRDAHITFICEETGDQVVRKIVDVQMMPRFSLPPELRDRKDLFTDDYQIVFILGGEHE